MQIILASAKIMHDKLNSIPDVNLSTPRFQNEAESYARDMAQYSTETIADMLGCSQQIAAQNKLRFMQFFDEKPKLPAILAYHGQAYKHLKAETLTVDDLNYSQGKLWITSFLYGLPPRNTSTSSTGNVSVRRSVLFSHCSISVRGAI